MEDLLARVKPNNCFKYEINIARLELNYFIATKVNPQAKHSVNLDSQIVAEQKNLQVANSVGLRLVVVVIDTN